MVAFFCRERGTNATARSQNASGCCAAGRPPSANVGRAAKRRSDSNMLRPNADVVVGGVRRAGRRWPKIRLSRRRRAARGHAALPFLKISAIVRAVTNRSAVAVGARLSTAARIVGAPHAACRTGNASARPASGKPPNASYRVATRSPDQPDRGRPAPRRGNVTSRPPLARRRASAALSREPPRRYLLAS